MKQRSNDQTNDETIVNDSQNPEVLEDNIEEVKT